MKTFISFLGATLLASQVFAQNILAQVELEAENIDKVEISGSFVDVYVTDGERNFLSGKIQGSGDEGDYDIETEIVKRTLVVRVKRDKNRNWRSYKIYQSRIDLTIVDGVSIDIDNSSGDVYVANLRAPKSSIEASSGDITLKSIIANLSVQSSSGDIAIDGLIGDSDIRSTSGSQELSNVTGDLTTRATSGDIEVTDFEGKLRLETTSGEVELKKGVGALKVKTTSGDIEGYGINVTDNCYFDATSGSIDMDLVNELETLSFDLTATSGDLDVGSISGDRRLILDRGGFQIISTTSSGDQQFE